MYLLFIKVIGLRELIGEDGRYSLVFGFVVVVLPLLFSCGFSRSIERYVLIQ